MKIRINRRIVMAAGLIFGLLALLVFFSLLSSFEEKQSRMNTENTSSYSNLSKQQTDLNTQKKYEELFNDGQKHTLNSGIETVLVMGIDQFEENLKTERDAEVSINSQESDFFLLLVLDHDNKTCTPIHINRDTMADVSVITLDGRDRGTVRQELVYAHTYGTGGDDSCKNTVSAVSNLMYGIPINHYMAFTMESVVEVNDKMGGITLEVMDDFTMVDSSMQRGKTMTLDGEQALAYVREIKRLKNSTNLRRMERQRQYLDILLETAREKLKDNDSLMLDTFMSVSPYLVTDCSSDQLLQTAKCVLEYDNKEILCPKGDLRAYDGNIEYILDDEALKELVLEVFYERDNTGK